MGETYLTAEGRDIHGTSGVSRSEASPFWAVEAFGRWESQNLPTVVPVRFLKQGETLSVLKSSKGLDV